MVPYAQSYMSQAANVAKTPFTAYTGDRYVDQNATQTAGVEQLRAQVQGGSEVNNAAADTLTKTLRGDYLSE